MIVQKRLWFAWLPALFRTAALMSSGIAARLARADSTLLSAPSVPPSALFRLVREAREDRLDVVVGPLRPLERLVRVVDVGLMVLGVVDLHRARVDRRLERVVGIRKGWKGERHARLLRLGNWVEGYAPRRSRRVMCRTMWRYGCRVTRRSDP